MGYFGKIGIVCSVQHRNRHCLYGRNGVVPMGDWIARVKELEAERDLAIEQRDAWRKAAESIREFSNHYGHRYAAAYPCLSVERGGGFRCTCGLSDAEAALKAARELMGES